jgi:hypothetical protein
MLSDAQNEITGHEKQDLISARISPFQIAPQAAFGKLETR